MIVPIKRGRVPPQGNRAKRDREGRIRRNPFLKSPNIANLIERSLSGPRNLQADAKSRQMARCPRLETAGSGRGDRSDDRADWKGSKFVAVRSIMIQK